MGTKPGRVDDRQSHRDCIDPDGKAAEGATVTVTDSATNESSPPVKTGDGGRFCVNELPPDITKFPCP